MAQFNIAVILVLFCILQITLSLPHLQKREAMSDGDAESIQAFYGFYGSPIYRPYGFGSWGYGSSGYGVYNTYVASPNIYGGYM